MRCAARTSKNAYWASWSDSLAMIRRRHPTVAGQLVDQLEGPHSCVQQQTRDGSGSWDSNHHLGRRCLMEPALHTGNLRTSNEALCDAAGSMRHVPELRGTTGGTSSRTHPHRYEHSSGRKEERGRSGSVRCINKSGNDVAFLICSG